MQIGLRRQSSQGSAPGRGAGPARPAGAGDAGGGVGRRSPSASWRSSPPRSRAIVAAYLPIRSECDCRPIIEQARRAASRSCCRRSSTRRPSSSAATSPARRWPPAASARWRRRPTSRSSIRSLSSCPWSRSIARERGSATARAIYDRALAALRGARRQAEARRHRFCDAGGRGDPGRAARRAARLDRDRERDARDGVARHGGGELAAFVSGRSGRAQPAATR